MYGAYPFGSSAWAGNVDALAWASGVAAGTSGAAVTWSQAVIDPPVAAVVVRAAVASIRRVAPVITSEWEEAA